MPRAALSGIPAATSREQTAAEERANVLTALPGVLLALAALPLLAATAHGGRLPLLQAGAAAYGVSLLVMAVISAAYHALPAGEWKRRAQVADRLAIYALIAGTYSPFALGPLLGHGGGWLFAAEWLAAGAGALFVLRGGIRHRRWSLVIYLVMGWLGLVIWEPFQRQVPEGSLFWLLAGGVIFSAGVPFYVSKRLPYGHAVWHLFVLAGAVSHFLAVLEMLRATR